MSPPPRLLPRSLPVIAAAAVAALPVTPLRIRILTVMTTNRKRKRKLSRLHQSRKRWPPKAETTRRAAAVILPAVKVNLRMKKTTRRIIRTVTVRLILPTTKMTNQRRPKRPRSKCLPRTIAAVIAIPLIVKKRKKKWNNPPRRNSSPLLGNLSSHKSYLPKKAVTTTVIVMLAMSRFRVSLQSRAMRTVVTIRIVIVTQTTIVTMIPRPRKKKTTKPKSRPE
mmetsp:Transcript_19824/g.48708  ORF Transcript_19824/g.48708 Transcript_19824/m.48708 type:complete len:223 (-) Transcript_19824:415-1083(-)